MSKAPCPAPVELEAEVLAELLATDQAPRGGGGVGVPVALGDDEAQGGQRVQEDTHPVRREAGARRQLADRLRAFGEVGEQVDLERREQAFDAMNP